MARAVTVPSTYRKRGRPAKSADTARARLRVMYAEVDGMLKKTETRDPIIREIEAMHPKQRNMIKEYAGFILRRNQNGSN